MSRFQRKFEILGNLTFCISLFSIFCVLALDVVAAAKQLPLGTFIFAVSPTSQVELQKPRNFRKKSKEIY